MSPRRSFLRTAVLLPLVLLALGYLVSFLIVFVASRQDDRRPADAIVVLGAAQYNGRPSPVLRARLDHGIDLYQEGLAPLLIVTGGTATGDTVSEAIVGRRYALARGVPDSAVIVRPEGRSTGESMEAVGRWIRERGLDSVVLVSDPFHMCRLRMEAGRVHLTAFGSPTRTSPISESLRREIGYLATEAVKMPVAWVRSW